MYWFLNAKNEVLYVGKAKSLRKRVTSYQRIKVLSQRINDMVHQASQVRFETLGSELEALLVEAELIRLHQPPFNVLLKDDKTPLYIHLTKETYPRVLTIRKKEVDTQKVGPGVTLGPFPSGYKVKEVLKIARAIFPWCNQRGNKPVQVKACFYHHLQLCNGACIGQVSIEEYKQTIKALELFLRGKKRQVVKEITQEMKAAAAEEQFEKAMILKEKIALINSVTNQEYRMKPDLTLPRLRESISQEGLLYLQKLLSQHGLAPRTLSLRRIEGYDVSNIQGTDAAVAMVVFTDGQPDFAEYRVFNIKTLNTPNDYYMMQEALQRRQNHLSDWGEPDLLVIDGGKGQLRAARNVWHSQTPIISIAKRPDRIIVPTNHDLKKPTYAIHNLPENHPMLKLIQQVRDEAHRFSKKQHTRLHTKTILGK